MITTRDAELDRARKTLLRILDDASDSWATYFAGALSLPDAVGDAFVEASRISSYDTYSAFQKLLQKVHAINPTVTFQTLLDAVVYAGRYFDENEAQALMIGREWKEFSDQSL